MALPNLIESAPVPSPIAIAEDLTTPYVIKLLDERKASPIGVSYLGATALFNPGVDLLSARERQCVAYGMIGESNESIGSELYLSTDTVKTHMRRTFRKLAVENRAELLDRCLDEEVGVLVMTKPCESGFLKPYSWRERQVMVALAQGQTNRSIASELYLSPLTIKSHLARISRKVGYGNRSIVSSIAVFSGWTGKVPAAAEESAALYNNYISYARQRGVSIVRAYTTAFVAKGPDDF